MLEVELCWRLYSHGVEEMFEVFDLLLTSHREESLHLAVRLLQTQPLVTHKVIPTIQYKQWLCLLRSKVKESPFPLV